MGKEAEEQRRVELGEVAYEAYRRRLAIYQPERCLEWHRVPPYMRDVWAAVAEAVIGSLERELEQLKKLRCSCPAFGGVNDFCPIHGQYLKVTQQRETNK
jgi:hypothetical protein